MSENKRRPYGDDSHGSRYESRHESARPENRPSAQSRSHRYDDWPDRLRRPSDSYEPRRTPRPEERPSSRPVSSSYSSRPAHRPADGSRSSSGRRPASGSSASGRRPGAPSSGRRPAPSRSMPSTARHGSKSTASSARRRPNNAPFWHFPKFPHLRFPRAVQRPGQNSRRRRHYRVDWVRLVVLTVCLGIMLFGATNLIIYFANSHKTRQTNDELLAMRSTPSPDEISVEVTAAPVPTPTPMPALPAAASATQAPEKPPFQYIGDSILPEMQKLYGKNSDLVGWIDIPKVLSLPVVYRDNSFYLTHDFYGRDNKSGTVFLDEFHPFNDKTQYIVLHGHSMHDGSMFGRLTKYAYGDFLREHGLMTYSSLYKQETYVVFAVLTVPGSSLDPDFLPYTGMPTFSSDAAFNEFIQTLKERSLYNTSIDVQPTDALMTLSTCLEDDRIIIVSRRQREGETLESLQFAVSQMVGK